VRIASAPSNIGMCHGSSSMKFVARVMNSTRDAPPDRP